MRCPICGKELEPTDYSCYTKNHRYYPVPNLERKDYISGWMCTTYPDHKPKCFILTQAGLYAFQNIRWELIRPSQPPSVRKVSSKFIGTRKFQT